MENVLVELTNSKSGCAIGREKIRKVIFEKCQEGYKFVSYVPTKIGPSGKVLSYDLLFTEGKITDLKFESFQAENRKSGCAEFKGYDSLIHQYEIWGYTLLGVIPTMMGPSGKALEIDLVFAR